MLLLFPHPRKQELNISKSESKEEVWPRRGAGRSLRRKGSIPRRAPHVHTFHVISLCVLWQVEEAIFGGCLFGREAMAITSGEGMQGPSSQFNRSESPLSLSSSGEVVAEEVVCTRLLDGRTRKQK